MEAILKEFKGLKEDFTGFMSESGKKASEMDQQLKQMTDAIAELQTVQFKSAVAGRSPNDVADMAEMIRAFKEGNAPEYKSVGSVANPSTGGYLAAPVFVNKIFSKLDNANPIMAHAENIQIDGNVAMLPLEIEEVKGNWVGELEPTPAAAYKLGMLNVPVNEYVASLAITETLLEDSNVVGIENYLVERTSKAFDKAIGKAFVSGTGANMPNGVFVNQEILANAITSSNSGKIGAKDLLDAMSGVPSEAMSNAKWFMSAQTFFKIAATIIEDSSVIQMPTGIGLPAMLYGYPVVFIDAPEIKAGEAPILFGDMFNAYKVITRRGMTFQRDPYSRGDQRQVVLRFSTRIGGAVAQPSSLQALKVKA